MQRRALAAYGIGDGGGEAVRPFPFAQWPHRAIAANLIDTPVDLQAVPVRIAEFDGDLAAGAAPALEINGDAVLPQVIARAPPRRVSQPRRERRAMRPLPALDIHHPAPSVLSPVIMGGIPEARQLLSAGAEWAA